LQHLFLVFVKSIHNFLLKFKSLFEVYDLEERLINYGVAIIDAAESMNKKANLFLLADDIDKIIAETSELIAIFVKSIQTAEKRLNRETEK
jgi:hypothetical protein